MFSLIKNEFIKLFHRPIFYISLGLIVILITGMIIFLSIQSRNYNNCTYQDNYNTAMKNAEDYKKSCGDNTECLEHYKQEVESAKLKLKYQVGKNDWRETAINDYCNFYHHNGKNTDEQTEKILKTIDDNDWRAYVELTKNKFVEISKSLDKESYDYKYNQVEINGYDLMLKFNIKPNSFLEPEVLRYNQNCRELLFKEENFTIPGFRFEHTDQELEKQNKVLLYRIENGIIRFNFNPEASIIDISTSIAPFIMLLLLIISTITFTSEFSKKTIKHLIMCPYGRTKVALSKLITLILTALSFFALIFLLSIILSAILMPDNVGNLRTVIMPGNTLYVMSFYSYTLIKLLLNFVTFLFYLSIIFFMSIFTHSSVATLAIGIIPAMSTYSVVRYLYSFYKWGFLKYLPFVTCDFTQYLNTQYFAGDFNLTVSLIITLGTMLILTLPSFIKFKRLEL